MKQIDLRSDTTTINSFRSRYNRLKKFDVKELQKLSNELGVDGDSLTKNIDLDRDGKLSSAEFQHGLQLLQKALETKLKAVENSPVDFGEATVVTLSRNFAKSEE